MRFRLRLNDLSARFYLGCLLEIYAKASSICRAISLTNHRTIRPTAPSVAAIHSIDVEDLEVFMESPQIRPYIPLDMYSTSNHCPSERV